VREAEQLVSELERRATGDPRGHAGKVGPQKELLEFSRRHLTALREHKARVREATRVVALQAIADRAEALSESVPRLETDKPI
jgi:hypothetical protein